MVLLAAPAQAWTGTVSGGGMTYNGKDDPALAAPYALVFGSGDWDANPAGGWSSINIASSGTVRAIPDCYGGGNAWSGLYNIGFSFTYFGTAYTQYKGYCYGGLGFGVTGNPTNFVYPMNSASNINNIIAPVWDRSMNAGCPGANTRDQVVGTAPYRVFVFQFTNIAMYNGGACNQGSASYGTNTYQIRLYETTNVIEVHYQHTSNLDPYGGSERYAGIRGPAAASGLGYPPVECAGCNAQVQVNNRVVQYRPQGLGAIGNADTYALNYNLHGPDLMVDGASHSVTGMIPGGPYLQPASARLLANDPAIGSASQVATYNAGSLNAGQLTTITGGVCGVYGTNQVNQDGGFCFKPPAVLDPCAASAGNPYSFTYGLTDGWGTLNAAITATITLSNCNQSPVAGNDPQGVVPATDATYYLATEDTPMTVAATAPGSVSPTTACPPTAGLLCNDTDPDVGQTATLTVDLPSTDVTGLTLGTLGSTLTTGGAFGFTPTANACGTNYFDYKAKDTIGALSPAARAYIRVACTHDAPLATADAYTFNEDTTLTANTVCPVPSDQAFALLCNDVDADTGDSNTVTTTAGIGDSPIATADKAIQCTGPGQTPLHAAAFTLNNDGSFTFTPVANYYGADAFWYKVRDGQTSAESACVQVALTITNVPDAPDAVADAYNNVPNAGTTIVTAALGLLANDVDNDNAPVGQAANFGLSAPPPAPTVTCTPGATANIASYNTDGSFSVTLNAIDPSTYSGTCSFTYTASDGSLTDTAAVVLNIVVPTPPFAISDSCTLQEDIIVTTPANLAPVVCPNLANQDIPFTSGSPGTPAYAIVAPPNPAHGIVTLLDAATGQFKFEPAPNFNGASSFTYRFTQDPDGTGPLLPVTSNEAVVGVTVLPVNDFPSATAKSYTLNEDCSASVASSCAVPFVVPAACGGPVQGLLCELAGYDEDAADSPNHDVTVVVPPTLPIVTSKGQVTAMTAAGGFTYIPNPHANGIDSFTFLVVDDGPTGLPNVALNPTPITVTLNVVPVDEPPVALIDACLPTYPTTSYVPVCPGPASPYLAFYGHIMEVPATLGVLANDYDPDNFPDAPLSNDGLFVDCIGGCAVLPAEGSLSVAADGALYYIPPATGTACMDVPFTYRARDVDGDLSSVTNARIRVCPNIFPVAGLAMTPTTVVQGGTVTFTDLSSDSDGTVVAWLWQFGDSQSSTAQNPTHVYLEPGVYTVTLTVTDNIGDFTSLTSTVTVLYVPDPSGSAPVAQNLVARAGPDQLAAAGAEVLLAGSAIGTSTPEFRWSQVSGPTVNLLRAGTANPTFVAPPVLSPADVRLRLVVADGSRESEADEVLIRVTPANRAPSVAVNAPREVGVGDSVSLDAHASQDPDGDTLQFTWTQVGGPRVELRGEPSGDAMSFVVPMQAAGQTIRVRVVATDGSLSGVSEAVVFVRPLENAEELFRVGPIGSDGRAAFDAMMAGTTLWDFGDGSPVASGASVEHAFHEGGTFVVTVQIEDASGEIHTYSRSITVPPVALAASDGQGPATQGGSSSTPWVFVAIGAGLLALVGGGVAVVLKRAKK